MDPVAAAEGGDRRAGRLPEPEQHLACPRCDSTNTKFCYYNNYNLSQPRHFCKSCRRYWTHGGTLRNVPVGGSSRKNSKRSRPPPSSAGIPTHHGSVPPPPAAVLPAAELRIQLQHQHQHAAAMGGASAGSFTSLLNSQGGSSGFLALGGAGQLEEMGYGMGGGIWSYPGVAAVDGGSPDGASPGWQFGGGGEGRGQGGFSEGDCSYAWPELAVSMAGKTFK